MSLQQFMNGLVNSQSDQSSSSSTPLQVVFVDDNAKLSMEANSRSSVLSPIVEGAIKYHSASMKPATPNRWDNMSISDSYLDDVDVDDEEKLDKFLSSLPSHRPLLRASSDTALVMPQRRASYTRAI